MRSASHNITAFVRRWWFALLTVFVLMALAVAATPSGQALAGEFVQATARYYRYLALIFNNARP